MELFMHTTLIFSDIPDKASFHLMGNLNNLYKYEEWKEDMKKYYIEKYIGIIQSLVDYNSKSSTLEQELLDYDKYHKDLEDFDILWINEEDNNFKYQLYTETIHNLLITEDKYKIGDIFYIEHEYETRQYYGIGRISYDIENNKKILYLHNDDGFCINDKIFPKKIQELIDEKPNFYENVIKDYEKYFVESYE